MLQPGSRRESHWLRSSGRSQNSTQSKYWPKRVIATSMKSAYDLGISGGDENFGTIPMEGGVCRKHGSMRTCFARRSKSQAYQPSPSDAYQSAHEIEVRISLTPSSSASASTDSTRSNSPGRNHSTSPGAVTRDTAFAGEGLLFIASNLSRRVQIVLPFRGPAASAP